MNYLLFSVSKSQNQFHLVFIRKANLRSGWHQEMLAANLSNAGLNKWNFPGSFIMVHGETLLLYAEGVT